MDFEEKKARAIQLMDDRKMWKSNYAPPLLRLLWKAGVKVPPLPFAPFGLVFLICAGWFAPVWGLWMWFTTWNAQGMSVHYAFLTALISGGLFGLSMALIHFWRRKANALPSWQDLDKQDK